jgi:hypothetical protein
MIVAAEDDAASSHHHYWTGTDGSSPPALRSLATFDDRPFHSRSVFDSSRKKTRSRVPARIFGEIFS